MLTTDGSVVHRRRTPLVVYRSCRHLRSASSSLIIRRTRFSAIGDQAFPVAAELLGVVEYSAAERHVNAVTDCLSETSED